MTQNHFINYHSNTVPVCLIPVKLVKAFFILLIFHMYFLFC